MRPFLGIVTGMDAEAKLIREPGIQVRVSGADPDRAEEHARALLAEGVQALVSFGLCGGTDPGLQPGTIIVAEAIDLPTGERIGCEEIWGRRVARQAPPGITMRLGLQAGRDEPALTPQAKADLAAQGIHGIDMESHRIARAARRAGKPILAIRAIVDPFDLTVPAWLFATLTPEGRPDSARVLSGMLRHPTDLSTALTLRRNMRMALKALKRVVSATGSSLAY